MADLYIEDSSLGEFDYGAALATVDQEVIQIVTQPFMEQWPIEHRRGGRFCWWPVYAG